MEFAAGCRACEFEVRMLILVTMAGAVMPAAARELKNTADATAEMALVKCILRDGLSSFCGKDLNLKSEDESLKY